MTTTTTACAEAEQAAESVRALNHATLLLTPGCLLDPIDAYRILGDLAALCHRLPQALEQIGRHLDAQRGAGDLALDDNTTATPTYVVNEIRVALDGAARSISQAARSIDTAHAQAARLYRPSPDDR